MTTTFSIWSNSSELAILKSLSPYCSSKHSTEHFKTIVSLNSCHKTERLKNDHCFPLYFKAWSPSTIRSTIDPLVCNYRASYDFKLCTLNSGFPRNSSIMQGLYFCFRASYSILDIYCFHIVGMWFSLLYTQLHKKKKKKRKLYYELRKSLHGLVCPKEKRSLKTRMGL